MKKMFMLVLLAGCTTGGDGSAPAATSATRPAATSEFRNLQVFPRDIPHDRLIAAMRGFSRGLGVRCGHCHVVTATEPKEQFDFASDAKEDKQVARAMLRMTMEINGTWLPRAAAAEGKHNDAAVMEGAEPRVTCWTCHRGKTDPERPPVQAESPARSE